MKLPWKKKIQAEQARTIWNETNVRTADRLRVHYRPQDREAMELLDKAWGVVHRCAMTNATVCAKVGLHLMRRADMTSGAERRSVKGHRVPKHKRFVGKAGVYSIGAMDVEEVTDHPVLDLLNRPNRMMSGSAMATNRFYFKDIVGRAFSFMGYEGSIPVSLWPLLPQYTMLNITEEEGLVGFLYGRSDTNWAEFGLDDVLYHRYAVSRFNPYEGEGPLAAVMPYADIIAQTAIHDLAQVHNGYKPDSIVSLPAGTTPEQVKIVEREINAKGGARSGGKAHVTSGEIKIEPLAWPPKELQTEAQLERYAREVRLAFGHTDSMYDSNDSTYASAVVGYSEQYMGGAIGPRLERDAEELTLQLLPLFGLDPDVYFFCYDDPVERDREMLSVQMDRLSRGGILTINEARSELGYESFADPNADKLMVNGVALGASPEPQGFGGFSIPGSFLSAQPSENSLKSETKTERPDTTGIQIRVKDLVDQHELPEWQDHRCGCSTKDDDDIAPDPLLQRVFREYGPELEPAFRDILADMQDEVIEAERAGRQPNLRPLQDQAASELVQSMRGIVDLAMEDVQALAEQNGRDAFSVKPESALRFLENHAIRVAEDIANTTETMIRPAIRRGLDEGLSIADIAAQIEGENIPAYRAERIARTEMSAAANGARYEGWRDIGVSKVEWLTAPGASEAHKMIAARSPKPVGEPFVKAGETLDKETFSRDVYAPPARPNCRCTAVAVFDDEGDNQ